MRRWISLFAPFVISISTLVICPAEVRAAPPPDSFDLSTYHSANGLANRGLFQLAVPEYEKFLATHGSHGKADMARYGLSVCLYRMKRFEDAISQLDKLAGNDDFVMATEVVCMRGQCRLALRRFAEAAEDFRRVVKTSPDHALADDAAAGAIEAAYALGRYAAAVKASRRFATRWPRSPLRERTTYFWALSAVGKDDYETAIARLEYLLQAWPKSAFAEQSALILAQCYQRAHLIDKAARLYGALVKQGGDSSVTDALFGLGTLSLDQGEPAQAAAYFDQLLERGGDSPRVVLALFHRARASFDLAHYDEALALFQRFAASSKDAGLADDAAYWSAKCKLRLGRNQEAAADLAQAADQFDDSELQPELQYDLAIALIRSDKKDDGVAALERFLKRFEAHPMVPDALYLLAATEHRRGHYARSRTVVAKFLAQFSSHDLAPQVLFLSAENALLDGDFAEAAGAYRRFLRVTADDESRVRALYRLGHALWRLGKPDEARRSLKQVHDRIETEESFRYGHYILGDIAHARGEWKTAQKELSAYLQNDIKAASADDAWLKLGLSLERLERSEEALRAFDRLIAAFPDSPHHLQALFERGQALLALGRDGEAEVAFRLVLANGGDSRFKPHALNHLASLAVKREDFEGAAKLYAQVGAEDGKKRTQPDTAYNRARALFAAGKLSEAEAAFESLLDRFPTHDHAVAAAVQLGMVYARQEKCEKALSYLDRVSRRDEKVADGLRTSALYEKAWCLRKLGKSDEAASTYRALLDGGIRTETHLDALVDLALIEIEASRYEAAAELLSLARQQSENASISVPSRVVELGTYYLGLCRFELGALSQATELFDEFLAMFGDSPLVPSASFYCGEAFYKQDKYKKAIEHLSGVVKKSEKDPAYGPSLLRLGECLAEEQRWPRSEETLRKYISAFADSPQWYQAQFGIGWAAENQGRYDDAVAAYKEVVSRHKGPTAARAQFQIGECLFAKKKYAAAATELLKVDILYAYPEWSAAALFEAGRCFEKLQKRVEARAQFKAVTEHYGDTRWARMASQRLTELSASVLPGR